MGGVIFTIVDFSYTYDCYSWGGDWKTVTDRLKIAFYPDYIFQSYSLYFNDGNGYHYHNCLNARGNVDFKNVTRDQNADYYIGNGNPADTGLSAGLNASSLIGQKIGFVWPRNDRGLIANIATVSSLSLNESTVSICVNNSSYGKITNNIRSLTLLESRLTGYSIYGIPSTIKYGNYNVDTSALNNASLVGFVVDGEQTNSNVVKYPNTSFVAVYGPKFTVNFNLNGGIGSAISSITAYHGVDDYYPQGNLPACNAIKNSCSFVGWNTKADGTGVAINDLAAVSSVYSSAGLSPNGSVTLYAQYGEFEITVNKSTSNNVSVSSVGTLSLFDVTNNATVATESDGVLYYKGVADGSHKYRIVCTLSNGKPDLLWQATGVLVDGAYVLNHEFTPSVDDDLSYDFYFTKRDLYSVGINIVVKDKDNVDIVDNKPTCTASVTSPSEPDDEGKYLVGRSITITGVPASGYEMKLARVGGDEYSNLIDNKFTIPSLNSDVTASCYFTKIVYLLKAEIDAASSSAIRKVTVDDGTAQQATYGDTVVYEATLNDDTDAVFDGWYDGETLVSTENPYSHTVIGNTTLVAKVKVSVTLDIHYGDSVHQESCSLKVDNAAYVRGTPFDVTLGKSFSFELLLGMLEESGSELWKFDSWYYASDIDRENPIALGTSDNITPTANLSLVADVTSEVLVKTLTVVLKNEEDLATMAVADAIRVYPEADDHNYENGEYTFVFNGSKSVRLSAEDGVSVDGSELAFSKFDDSGVEHGYPDYEFVLTARSKRITAFYGSTGLRTTTLMYGTANGVTGNRTMGTFAIVSTDDTDGTIEDGAQSAEVHRGKNIVIVATPNNGYKFGGWYTVQEIGGSAYLLGTTSTLRVTTNRTLYAWFIQDPNAIYEWEGGQSNKSFEWRSKTYTSNKPFNPSCCRVDAQGYPVIELDVDMFSAPNSALTARAIVANIASQDARRLPPRRPERYLQVCVKNDKEVDSIIVGTNMTELAQ